MPSDSFGNHSPQSSREITFVRGDSILVIDMVDTAKVLRDSSLVTYMKQQ